MRKGTIDISGVIFMFVKVIYARSLEGHIGLLPEPIHHVSCFLEATIFILFNWLFLLYIHVTK